LKRLKTIAGLAIGGFLLVGAICHPSQTIVLGRVAPNLPVL